MDQTEYIMGIKTLPVPRGRRNDDALTPDELTDCQSDVSGAAYASTTRMDVVAEIHDLQVKLGDPTLRTYGRPSG